ncbi:MAG: phosphohistidine phosphatase SixA [Spirochaetes bacterium]|nr:phosphohistidine phosphatase SixA [Spirochaetota bacterium]
MKVYLVQHGQAKHEDDGAGRPLTAKGVEETAAMAKIFAASGLVSIDIIFHSDKQRAKETAGIFAAALHPAKGLRELDGIGPTDDVEHGIRTITSVNGNCMLVGHLPHLSNTVSKLVLGDEDTKIAAFTNSGVICLEKKEYDSSWYIVPALSF